MNPVVVGALTLLTGFVLLVLPFLIVRFISRRLTGSADHTGSELPPGGWACARCGSGDVGRLPGDGVSPYRSYKCGECGARMRPRGSGPVYFVVLLVSLGLFAGATAPLWADIEADRFPIGIAVVAAGVAVYCLTQLARPVVRRPPASPNE